LLGTHVVGQGNDVLLVVERVHGSVGIGIVGETHESETSAAAGVAVLYDNLLRREHVCFRAVTGVTRIVTDCFFDLAELLKLLAKSTIVRVPGKATVSSQSQRECRNGRNLPNEELGHFAD
jgi:hypothetical protein